MNEDRFSERGQRLATPSGSVPHEAQRLVSAGRAIRWPRRYDLLVAVMMLGRAQALRRQTVSRAGIVHGEQVLDVGCGTGDLTIAAARVAGDDGAVWGIDVAEEMIEVATRKAKRADVPAHFRVGLLEALPFPDATFDVVLSSLMMHHLPLDLQRRGLAEVRRVLRPGGRLLIVDFRRPTGRHSHLALALLLHAGLRRGVQELAVLMQDGGFVRVETGEMGFPALGFARGYVA